MRNLYDTQNVLYFHTMNLFNNISNADKTLMGKYASVTCVHVSLKSTLIWGNLYFEFFSTKHGKNVMSKSLFSSDSFIQFYRVFFLISQNYKVNIEKWRHMETCVLTTLRQTKSKWHKEEQSLLSFHWKKRQKALGANSRSVKSFWRFHKADPH